MSALVRAALAAARRSGCPLVVLDAGTGGLYGRHGFGPAVLAARYRVRRPVALAPSTALGAELGAVRVRLLRPDEALEAFPLLHDEARRLRAGEVLRPEAAWEELLSPAGPDGPGAGAPRLLAGAEAGGRFDGYAVYDLLDRPGPERRLTLRLVDLAALSPAAYAALWAYLIDIEPVDEVVTAPRPPDEPLRHLLADPRALEATALVDRSWLRLVDVRAALAGRRYRDGGRLGIALVDEACPWNAGTYLLLVETGGGVPAVEGPLAGGTAGLAARTSGAAATPVLRTDAAALASAYLGGTSFAALATAGRVLELSAGAIGRADELFATALAPACSAEL
jgi:predicted acetyltransferase